MTQFIDTAEATFDSGESVEKYRLVQLDGTNAKQVVKRRNFSRVMLYWRWQ